MNYKILVGLRQSAFLFLYIAFVLCITPLTAVAALNSGGGNLTREAGIAAVDDYPYAAGLSAYLEAKSLKQRQAAASAHVPSDAVAYTKSASVNSAGLSKMRASQDNAAVPAPMKGTAGFSKELFNPTAGDSPQSAVTDWKTADKRDQEEAEEKSGMLNGAVDVSGGMHPLPADRLEPAGAPLPGTRHTMTNDVHVDAPEMNVALRVSDTAKARLALNSQDQTSPLYRRVVKEDSLNSTGAYLEFQVKEGVQVHFGGEVHKYAEDEHEDDSDVGAVMGLRWDF